MIAITFSPAGRGRFDAFAADRYLVTSRSPFVDAARALAAQGADPSTPIALHHAGSDEISLSTIGALAGQVEDLAL